MVEQYLNINNVIGAGLFLWKGNETVKRTREWQLYLNILLGN